MDNADAQQLPQEPTERGDVATDFKVPQALTRAWKVLHTCLRPRDEDSDFWWQTTGPCLALLMQEAGYDLHGQYEGLLFHVQYIIGRLGPRPLGPGPPKHWKSFMTDDFSPLEYSWNWDVGETRPTIRYCIETISSIAGTRADPFNQMMTKDLISQLSLERPEIKWEWFEQLSNAFQTRPTKRKMLSRRQSGSHSSSVFIGFELSTGHVATKAYFIPVKAEQLGISKLTVLTEGVRSLESDVVKFPAYERFLSFASTSTQGSQMEIIGAAIDCVDPIKSRLKLYVRSLETSFDSVCAMLSMNHELDTLSSGPHEELKALWYLVLGLEQSYPASRGLTSKLHETAGVLYNFDIKAGNSEPETKVYIPVRHYGRDDLAIAQGLLTYLKSRGRDQYAGGYVRALEGLCSHRPLGDECGLHTYISVSFKKGKLALTSYLAPEIYHRARW